MSQLAFQSCRPGAYRPVALAGRIASQRREPFAIVRRVIDANLAARERQLLQMLGDAQATLRILTGGRS